MSRACWVIAGVAIGIVSSRAGAFAQARQTFTLSDGRTCHLAIGAEQELQIGSERVVVQPDAVNWQGSDLLILGENGLTYREDTLGQMKVVRRISGILVKADGKVFPIPPVPVALGFHQPRVLTDKRRGWHVVFSDSTPDQNSQQRLWYAHLSGTRWTRLDSITSLPAGSALIDNPSSLRLTAEGRLIFAIRTRHPRTVDRILGMVQGAKQWRVDTLARSTLISYFDLLPTRNGLTLAAAMRPLSVADAPMGLWVTDSTGGDWSVPRLLAEKRRGAARPQFVPEGSRAVLVWHLSGSSRRVDSASVWAARLATGQTPGLSDPLFIWEGIADGLFDPLYLSVRDLGTMAILREPLPDSMLKIVSISERAVVSRIALPGNTFSFAVVSRDHALQFVEVLVSGTERGDRPYLARKEIGTTCFKIRSKSSPTQ